MVYGDYISLSGSGEKAKAVNNLPKYSKYLYYFGIRFPELRNTIAGDMTILFFFTSILIISIVFFVYAIFVIMQQKRLSEMQKDFINNMTHEFKTPISTINISVDVITAPDILNDPLRLLKYGGIIRQENQRLNLLVEKVLQIAHIEKGGFKLKIETIDLNELIRTVAENFKTKLRPEGEIKLSLDPSVNLISADIIHLTNVLHNLLDNAIKYGPVIPVIQITTIKEPGTTMIQVSDNGPGIDPKHHKRIFHKFFRIPSGNIHDVKGFGLGLFYVKNICLAHKWNIYLNSEPGCGATFIIEIPEKR